LKIEAHVLEVQDKGDKLFLVGQGKATGAAEWQPFMNIMVSVPMNDRNRKAFYIGRHFDLTVTPR
jgi:hypothetical protein